jgi:hypothetical protein
MEEDEMCSFCSIHGVHEIHTKNLAGKPSKEEATDF